MKKTYNLPTALADTFIKHIAKTEIAGVTVTGVNTSKGTTAVVLDIDLPVDATVEATASVLMATLDNVNAVLQQCQIQAFKAEQEAAKQHRADFTMTVNLGQFPVVVLNEFGKRFRKVEAGKGEPMMYQDPAIHLRRVQVNNKVMRDSTIRPMTLGREVKPDDKALLVFDMTTHKATKSTVAFMVGQTLEHIKNGANKSAQIDKVAELSKQAHDLYNYAAGLELAIKPVTNYKAVTGAELVKLGYADTVILDAITMDVLPTTGKVKTAFARMFAKLFKKRIATAKTYQGQIVNPAHTYVIDAEERTVTIDELPETLQMIFNFGESECAGAGAIYVHQFVYDLNQTVQDAIEMNQEKQIV